MMHEELKIVANNVKGKSFPLQARGTRRVPGC